MPIRANDGLTTVFFGPQTKHASAHTAAHVQFQQSNRVHHSLTGRGLIYDPPTVGDYQAGKGRTSHSARSIPANDNKAGRRIITNLSPAAQVSLVEVETFDALIGSFAEFCANDNEQPASGPGIRGPP